MKWFAEYVILLMKKNKAQLNKLHKTFLKCIYMHANIYKIVYSELNKLYFFPAEIETLLQFKYLNNVKIQ